MSCDAINRDLDRLFFRQQQDLEETNIALLKEVERLKTVEQALIAAREDAVLAQNAAIKANEAKTRFLSAVSHDLRQPFQALRLFIEVLAIQLAGSRHEPVIAKAIEALESGEIILESQLDISLLEAGLLSVEKRRLPISVILHKIEEEFAQNAKLNNVTLKIIMANVNVISEERSLYRLLQQLVDNAIRFSPNGRVLIGCRSQGNQVRVEVWDTGLGISEDQFELIFEEFYQLDNNHRNRRLGLGLGLPIARRLAELLDHPLSLRSNVGVGSVFAVEIERSW